ILGKDDAYVLNSHLTSSTGVSITTQDVPQDPNTNEIDATIVAASVGIAAAGGPSGAVSIGASVARNFIGYNADGTPAAREVKAYAQGSSINAKAGDLLITATSKQTIHATVTAVSAAVAGSLVGGLAASGAGVDAENKIGATIQAYIDGD